MESATVPNRLLLTIPETAEELRVCERTVRRLIASRDLRTARGSRTRALLAGDPSESELRLLPGALVAHVAEREGVPVLVAQDLAARAVLNAAVRSERRQRERNDPRRQWLELVGYLLEKEET